MSDVAQGPGWWQAGDGKWYPPQPPEKKKRFYKRVWFWLLVVVALGIGGCVSLVTAGSVAISKQANTQHTVVYTVTGDGTALITYDTFTNGANGEAQDTNVTLPWTKTVTGSGLFNIYSVGADIDSGTTATCSITVDGAQVSTNTANGVGASADCTGSS
jgi:hypothetical protein